MDLEPTLSPIRQPHPPNYPKPNKLLLSQPQIVRKTSQLGNTILDQQSQSGKMEGTEGTKEIKRFSATRQLAIHKSGTIITTILKSKTEQEIIEVLQQFPNDRGMVELRGRTYLIQRYDEGLPPKDFHYPYLTRQQYLYESAKEYIKEKYFGNAEALIKKLDQINLVTMEQINNLKINQPLPILKEFIKQISDLGISKSDLKQAEKAFIKKNGRPTVINIYTYEGKKYISMQSPVNETIIPSSVRDEKGLVNYVTTSAGHIDEENIIHITFQATRHSSLPPIAIHNSSKRLAYACDNVLEKIRDYASQTLTNSTLNPTKEKPLEIPMSVMMLFSPKLGDSLRNFSSAGQWKGDSEISQLRDSTFALNMFRDRTIEIKIKVNGEEKSLWVKPIISYMNFGANMAATNQGFGRIPTINLQDQINARGFIEFRSSSLDFIGDRIKKMKDIADDDYITTFLNTYKRQLGINEKFKTKMAQIDLLKDQMPNIYEKLQSKLSNYTDENVSASTKSQLRKDIKILRKQIVSKEKTINKSYQKLLSLQKKIYSSHQHRLKPTLNELTSTLTSAKQEGSIQTNLQIDELLDFFSNFLLAQEIFYRKSYRQKNKVMDFQTLYIKSQEMRGDFVTFFCKSAEDRTGRVDDKIQEREIFKNQNGSYPRSDAELASIDKTISPVVHTFSASQENTEFNSGARGLQISPALNKHIAEKAKLGRQSAKLAKGVFNTKHSFFSAILNKIRNLVLFLFRLLFKRKIDS